MSLVLTGHSGGRNDREERHRGGEVEVGAGESQSLLLGYRDHSGSPGRLSENPKMLSEPDSAGHAAITAGGRL